MAKRTRLTNNSDETDIASLVSGDVVFAIPFFQRSYKWKPERLKQLNADILTIVDQASEFHFLGAVIIHGRSSNPSDPKVYEVIDGQQRITTLFLYIAAATRVLTECDQGGEAEGLFLKYLAIPRETSLHSNLKLHPCKEDRAQFNYVIADLLSLKGLKERLGTVKIKMLPPSGKEKGPLRNNYKAAIRFFRSELEQGGLDRVRAVYRAMLESMSVVQIDVWDPTNGPKIFDSLNSRQEPMTVGDLVRNEIFSRVADDHPDEIEQVDLHSWQPFYQTFQQNGHNLFDSYFFPYGLIRDPNLRKSEVYGALRDKWAHIEDPKEIIEQLAVYQDAFIDIVTGQNTQQLPTPTASLLENLHFAGVPSSTYPFLMQISQAVTADSIPEKHANESLRVIESFLVRRAVCGQEPTGLHAVFKRLWADCDGKPDGAKVTAAIRRHKTVMWPTDDAFKQAITSRPLYGAAITPYFLREYNRSLGGDQPAAIPWIEHILPVAPAQEWFKVFTKEQHEALRDCLANLIPLSKEMNAGLGNKAYPDKQKKYKDDSMFKSARELAQNYAEWTPGTLGARAHSLAKWAIERWNT
jgi:hypothetical protein